jgi:hypothetical protein
MRPKGLKMARDHLFKQGVLPVRRPVEQRGWDLRATAVPA